MTRPTGTAGPADVDRQGAVPPLVEPGPPLSSAEVARFSRHLLLPTLGPDGQRRLRNARVCVVGAGGLGSPVLQYLAAAGVGTLGIVDSDHVELSNLQRQVVHVVADLGRAKVASAAESVAAIDPAITVVRHELRLAPENVELLTRYDLVIDGTDNFATRYLVNDACVRWGLPEVWGSVLRFDAQVSVFWGRPPVDSGLAAVQLRDLFPEPPEPGSVPSCADAGVLGALCGQVGSLMAVEAVKLITGIGRPLLGRVLVLDALEQRWTEIPLIGAPPVEPPGPDRTCRPRPGPASRGARAGRPGGQRHLGGRARRPARRRVVRLRRRARGRRTRGRRTRGGRDPRVGPDPAGPAADRGRARRAARRADRARLPCRDPVRGRREVPARRGPIARSCTSTVGCSAGAGR